MTTYRFPRVQYADGDGVSIAYEVRGSAELDIVRVPASFLSLIANYLDPMAEAMLDRLERFARVINLDRRGTGLSDPLVVGATPPLEQRVTDVLAVMDAVGSRRASLFSGSDGGQVAILFAAMHPDRVDSLVLQNPYARFFRSGDYPFGLDPDLAEVAAQQCKKQWGNLSAPWGVDFVAPSRAGDPGFREVLARTQQVSASPSVAAALAMSDADVTDVLPLVQARTLVTYSVDARRNVPEHARFVAERIPDARLTAISSADLYLGASWEERSAVVEEFLTGARPTSVSDRLLATVLFTDIVGSTEHVARLGDREWRGQLDRHDALVRENLRLFRGREISTAGDGFFATFDGPARAIQCAQAIIDEARALGIDVRAGVHTGECEVRGDDLGGIAVHIGARVAALAAAGEVLATSTVKDLVAGSGIAFEDYGIQELKGIPDARQLYRVG
jgi:class 3 adenylate cyclase